MGDIKSFTDLIAWQKSHELVLQVYKYTAKFPKSESYGLIDQMRRCVVSIISNIVEGFSRRSNKEKGKFYYISLGSTTELQNQFLIAKDLKYIARQEFKDLADSSIEVHKLVNGLIKSSRLLNT